MGDFPGGPVVKDSALLLQGARVGSLVGQLRSCMWRVAKKKELWNQMNMGSNPNSATYQLSDFTQFT